MIKTLKQRAFTLVSRRGVRLGAREGFTLIELLVVIAIIGILASLIIVSLSGARGKAQDTQRKNNARNLDTALAQYYLDQTPNDYPIHAGVGGTPIVATSVPLGLTAYLTGTQSYESTLTHKYISGSGTYAQAWLLASNTETAVATGNGVYAVTGVGFDVTAGNALVLSGYGALTNKAFVTYGPQ